MFFESLWHEFALIPEVEAIALGGSRAGTHYDEKSDYDLYIYCTRTPEESIRKQILEKYCQYMEIGNAFWELEDDCTLKDGVDIDILYRNLEDFSQEVHSVVEKHIAHNGYTTCMWHNLRLLRGNLPSYNLQIKKAAARKDWVSVNHRTAAFLESYFDIIFALNKLTHPGEKRMVQYAREQAEVLPVHFEENLNCLFRNLFTDSDMLLQTIEAIISDLENVMNI